ncbi:MAG: LysR family transcriptional regulator [Bryobacteraceae bacterium]
MFLTVAEERSFRWAAKRLGITPSAVSHAMRDLAGTVGRFVRDYPASPLR